MWHVKLLQLQRTAARTQNPVAEGVNKQGDWQEDGGGDTLETTSKHYCQPE